MKNYKNDTDNDKIEMICLWYGKKNITILFKKNDNMIIRCCHKTAIPTRKCLPLNIRVLSIVLV